MSSLQHVSDLVSPSQICAHHPTAVAKKIMLPATSRRRRQGHNINVQPHRRRLNEVVRAARERQKRQRETEIRREMEEWC